MKAIRKILLALLVVIVVVLVAALFVGDEFHVEKEVTINKPKTEVFTYIKELKNQIHYSKWVMQDPNVKVDYTGTDGTVGFLMAWDSQDKHVGKGSQKITKISEGERLDMDIHFITPWEGNSTAYLSTEDAGNNQTKVKWGFNGKLNYMMKIMHLFRIMDKMVSDDLQTGLNNMKGVLEK